MAAALCAATTGAFAQQEAGTVTLQPKVGLNVSTITGDGTKAKVGFIAGVEGMYQLSDAFGVSAGLSYSMQGAKADGDGDLKTNLDYINIPILANYYVTKGLAIKAGIQPGFLMSAKAKYDGESVDIKDDCKTFDFSIPVGASYEFSNFVIDARYNIGLTSIADGGDGKNGVFCITVGYKFGL